MSTVVPVNEGPGKGVFSRAPSSRVGLSRAVSVRGVNSVSVAPYEGPETSRRESEKRQSGITGMDSPKMQKIQQRAEEQFKKLKKMFLGAITNLDEDAIKETLVESRELIDSGQLNINGHIKDTGSTFLHTAVWYRKLDLVKFLLAHGADPNARNIKGNTPLHFAVLCTYCTICTSLCSKHVWGCFSWYSDPKQCENADKDKSKEVIAALIMAGGDPLIKNVDKTLTPLDHAIAHGCRVCY